MTKRRFAVWGLILALCTGTAGMTTAYAADKTILKARINILNEDIERLNKKIQICKRIINKAEKGEKEDWIIQKRFQDNKERSEKENAKNKDRKKTR